MCRLTLGGGSSAAPSVSAAGDTADTKYQYRMDRRRRGQFIIINNKNFQRVTGMNERKGTDVDAANLKSDFLQLGFEATICQNQTSSQMLQLMIEGDQSVPLHCLHRWIKCFLTDSELSLCITGLSMLCRSTSRLSSTFTPSRYLYLYSCCCSVTLRSAAPIRR